MPWSMEDTVMNMGEIRDRLIEQVRQINLDGKGEEDVREINFDFDRVKNALNKQIPSKVREELPDEKAFQCPGCGKTILYLDDKTRHRYCLHCGQALDWETDI